MDGRIKVCFVSTFAYPLFKPESKVTFGGAEVQLYQISKELAKDKKYEVHFIVGDFGQRSPFTQSDVKIHKAIKTEKNLVNYILAAPRLYKTLKKVNPDVVIQRAAGPETGICAHYCNRNNKKFIYSIASNNNVTGELAKRGIFGRLFDYGIKNADFLIAQSQNQVNLLEKYKKRKVDNIKIIKSVYPFEKVNIRNKKSILWVSRSEKRKRPLKFLDLSKKFPEENFIIIMPKSIDIPLWEKVFKESKKISNLTFIESVPFHEIDRYFQEAKVFVNTSYEEGFPNTFIQAAKNKTPLLSLEFNPDNIITEYDCGVDAKKSQKRFEDGLKRILDPKNFKRYSNNALKYAKENHDITKNIKEWKDVINHA